MSKYFFSLLLLIGGIKATQLDAQKGWEVGGWLGVAQYYGDLNQSINLNDPGISGGLIGKYNFNTRVSLRGSLNYGNISATDADSQNHFFKNRNLSFHSHIIDFTGGIEFNFLEHIRGSKDAFYTPYIFLGASIFHFNPKAELNGETYSLQPLGTEGQDFGEEYHLISAGYTLGAGFKWDLTSDITLAAEFTVHRTMTDYLDDVSTTYPDLEKLRAIRGETAVALSDRSLTDGIAEPGRQRGNSKDKDRYTFISFSVTKFFSEFECPKISKIY